MRFSPRPDEDDPVFALKGGVAMELRLGLEARATKDYDAAYRERAGDMLDRLDEALAQANGDFTIRRTEPRRIRDTAALRVDLKLAYRGRSWSTVQLEVAPTEGDAGMEIDRVPAMSAGAGSLARARGITGVDLERRRQPGGARVRRRARSQHGGPGTLSGSPACSHA